MMSMGAASAPARSSSARFFASSMSGHAGDLEVGAELLLDHGPREHDRVSFFSTSSIAMRFFTFSRVVWRMMRPPVSSSVTVTTGPPLALVEVGLRVLDAIAGDHDRLLHEHRGAVRSS